MDVGCTAVCWSLNASTFIILFDMYIQHFPFHILLPSLFPLFLVETWEPISLGFHTLTPGMPQRLLVKLLVLFACFFFFFFSTTACRQFVGVFIAKKSRKTRSSRSPAPSWTCTKIGLGRVTKRGGGGGGGKAREKPPAPKLVFCKLQIYDFVRRRTRHFDWSIYCQSSSVWSHAEKKQISETK